MNFLDQIFNRHGIHPERIGQPLQLLAAALLFVLLLDSAFLSAAAVLSDHIALSFLLVVAAILNAPGLLYGLFVLQTKYREQLLGDEAFLRAKELHRARELTGELKGTFDKLEFDVTRIPGAAPDAGLSPTGEVEIKNRARELERAIAGDLGDEAGDQLNILAEAERELAHADLAKGNWKEGADRLARYLSVNPDDSREWFAQGTAYANSRESPETDSLSALAYTRALHTLPGDADRQTKARLHTYLAGVLKRDPTKYRLAEEELERARKFALPGSYEADDIHYNMAAIQSQEGETDAAMRELRQITDPWYFDAVKGHLRDYFANLAERPDFQALMAEKFADRVT